MSKIEMGKQYRTRDGREARIYAVDGGGYNSVHGAIKDSGALGEWFFYTWSSDGRVKATEDHERDLIEVRPRIKRTVWLNVYKGTDALSLHTSKRAADTFDEGDRLACIKVEIDCEGGEGLS